MVPIGESRRFAQNKPGDISVGGVS